MLREDHLAALLSRHEGDFVYPDYERHNLLHVPATLRSLFGHPVAHDPLRSLWQPHIAPGQYRNILLLLLDGFGYDQWREDGGQFALFPRIETAGVVAPITTTFPSSTAPGLTTFASGLPPITHGLLEWFLYMPQLEEVIMTLPFCHIGGAKADELLEEGTDPRMLFHGKTIYQQFADAGVTPHIFLHRDYGRSAYSSVTTAGSRTQEYRRLSDLLVHTRELLVQTTTPSFVHLYWPGIDSAGHNFGTHSAEYFAEVRNFSTMFVDEFIARLDERTAKATLLIVTADHGQIPVDRAETVYLNAFPEIVDAFSRNSRGAIIPPWGSCRDVYLQIRPELLAKTKQRLQSILGARADVVTSEWAMQQGLFGAGAPHPEFTQRVGNLVILPHDQHTVWFEHVPGVKMPHRGMHGGLSRQEMLIPFAAAPMRALQQSV